MKKTLYFALIPAVLLLGGGIILSSQYSQTVSSPAFTQSEANAASNLAVSQPPPPAPPAWAKVLAVVTHPIAALTGKIIVPQAYAQTCTGTAETDFSCYE